MKYKEKERKKMSELTELDNINREDEQREDIKKDTDARTDEKWYKTGSIRDEIHEVYHEWRRRNRGFRPNYLILDHDSYVRLRRECEQHEIVFYTSLQTFMGMKICIIMQAEYTGQQYHYVQIAQ